MTIGGIKNFQRTVRAQEGNGLLTANVRIDVYAVENAEWNFGEKEAFLQRVKDTCREVHKWLEDQLDSNGKA